MLRAVSILQCHPKWRSKVANSCSRSDCTSVLQFVIGYGRIFLFIQSAAVIFWIFIVQYNTAPYLKNILIINIWELVNLPNKLQIPRGALTWLQQAIKPSDTVKLWNVLARSASVRLDESYIAPFCLLYTLITQ